MREDFLQKKHWTVRRWRMIAGVGLDLCEIARMQKVCDSEAFCSRVFTDGEREYGASRAWRSESLAGMFAAKEAFAKATGLGLSRTGLKNVEVIHDESGRPSLVLNPNAAFYDSLRNARFHLSLSHDGGVAAAVVIYESEAER